MNTIQYNRYNVYNPYSNNQNYLYVENNLDNYYYHYPSSSLLLNNNNTYDYPSFIQTSTSSNHRKTLTNNMAVISEIEEHENKIVNEFCMLLEKSRQLFNGLR